VGFSVIDPDLLESLATGSGPTDGMLAVFLASPQAQQDPKFLAVAQHLTRLADGLYSGVLLPADVSRLQEVDGLKVSADRVLTVDPPQASPPAEVKDSIWHELSGTDTTVPQVDPLLAETRNLLNLKGSDQVIAIIDTGIDTRAVGLDGAGKVVYRKDFTVPSGSCTDGIYLDPYGHGTHVASIAAGATNSAQPTIEGVAPEAKLVDLRVFDCAAYGTTSQVDDALKWVLDNRDLYKITVVNLSLGVSSGPQDGTDTTSILVNRLVASGVFVSVAAGNQGDAPATIYSPASAQFATTVGSAAVNRYGSYLSYFSSQGPIAGRDGIDVLAAGSSIRAANSTWPAYSSMGPSVVHSGTSMAAPYVAGLAALLHEKSPSHAPSGEICAIGDACPEGVTVATMTNGLEDDMFYSAGDWFAPGSDAISGHGLVNATNSLLGASSPPASHVEGSLDAGSATLIAVPAHATGVTVTVVTDPSVADSAWSTEHFEYAWIDAAGVTSQVEFPCNLDQNPATTYCTWSVMWTPHEYYFYSPPSSQTTWLRLLTTKTVDAVVTAPGLPSALTMSNGIAADDLQLDAGGQGTLHVVRSLASALPSTLSFTSSAGVLTPEDATLPAGAAGTFVDVPVSRVMGYTPVAPESSGRLTVTSGGVPVAAVSIQYPSVDGLGGQLTAGAQQVKFGNLTDRSLFVASNGTIVGDSALPLLVRQPSTYGFYVGPYVVEPGSNDAIKIPIDQTTITAMSVEGLSADGKRVLMSEYPDGAGVVPGDDDSRTVYFVFDRESGTSVEIGSSTLRPKGNGPRLSSEGREAAYLVDAPGDMVEVYWQGGENFGTTKVVATFPAADNPGVFSVDATHVLVGVTDPKVGYPESRLYVVDGGSFVSIAPAYVGPSLSADGSAVAYVTANFTEVKCYRVSDGTLVSFDARGEGASALVAGNNCAYVVAQLERFVPYPGARGSLGFELVRLFPNGSRTLLAAITGQREASWQSDATGTVFVTSTGLALSPGDTNGLYDAYRGAYGAPQLAPPVVSSVSPPVGPAGGGTTVTLTGSAFTGASSVTFGGVAGTALSVRSATSLTVVTPAHAGGPEDVVVTTPKGSGPPGVFTYRAVATIASVSPGFGPTVGGTAVTVTGSGFTPSTQVTFGGVAGAGLFVASSTSLTVVTPAGTSAQAPVVVSSEVGDSVPYFFAFVDTSVVAETPTRIQDQSSFTAGVVRCYPVTGLATVPDGATGVLLNVTAVGPAGNGYVVVYPDTAGNGATVAPLASTVNFEPGKDVANSAMVAIPSDGKVCAYSAGGTLTRLILDVAGYVVPGSGITIQSAQRLLDTRQVAQQVTGPVAPNVVNTVQVTGHAGVPSGATAVVANVTIVGPTAEGHLRAWAAGTPVPNTSVVNYAPGQTKANGQIIALSPSGGLSFESFTGAGTSTNPVQVIIDVVGYVAAGSQFTPTAPTRIVETRASEGVVGPIPGALVPNMVYPVTLSDTNLIPATATAVVLNVTAVGPTEFGNLRVYPDTNGLGTTQPPNASNLNYIPGRAIPNMVIVQIPTDGRKIDFYNNQGLSSSRTHLIVDVIGYIDTPPI
jgi:subtilisin family serine protease